MLLETEPPQDIFCKLQPKFWCPGGANVPLMFITTLLFGMPLAPGPVVEKLETVRRIGCIGENSAPGAIGIGDPPAGIGKLIPRAGYPG